MFKRHEGLDPSSLDVRGPRAILNQSIVGSARRVDGSLWDGSSSAPPPPPDDRAGQYRAGFFVERPEVAVKMVLSAVRHLLFNDTRARKL